MKKILVMPIMIVLLIFLACDVSLKKEEAFYNTAFDALYDSQSDLSLMENIPSTNHKAMLEQISRSMDKFKSTKENLRALAKKRASNRTELRRFQKAGDVANDVFGAVWQEMVLQYTDSLEKISEMKYNIRRIQRSMPYLGLNKESDDAISACNEMEAILQDIIIENLKMMHRYLKENKKTLRDIGWSEYLEWRKFDED